jgi:hypothetical protein
MYLEPLDPPLPDPAPHLAYPHLRIVAAVARPDTDSGVTLLSEAGFARDRIEVIVVEEVPRLEEPLGGTGLHRFLVRLRLLRGDDLDELEQARRKLMNGHALIQVLVHGDEEQHRARAILSRHSCHALLWTVDDTTA